MVTYNASSARPARKSGAFGCLVVTVFLALIALLIGYIWVYPTLHARQSGIQTQGRVTDVTVCEDDGGDTLVRPLLAQDSSNSVTAEIEFTDLHGQKQDVSEDTCGDYTQGQTVTVWYLPQ